MEDQRPSVEEILTRLPELGPYGREAVLLRPEPGRPGMGDSSIGGPLLWPIGEPWPTCSVPDDEEPSGLPASAMVAVAQLYARDVPGPWWPADADLLQVLWCPNEHWDAPECQADVSPVVELRWRRIEEVSGTSAVDPPKPSRHYESGYLPRACVLALERVVDFPYRDELPNELQPELQRLVAETGPDGKDVITRILGWKVGGWPTWHLSEPFPHECETCEAPLVLLFTIASDTATGVVVGRFGELRIFACPADQRHPFQADLH